MQAAVAWSDVSEAARHFEMLRRPAQGLARLSIERDLLILDAFEDVAGSADGQVVVPIKHLADHHADVAAAAKPA
jgi:hypothetical protein